MRIPEAYSWLLVPGQPDPKGPVEWSEFSLKGSEALATRAAKKLKKDELLTTEFGATRLRHELDRVPLWRGNHVSIKQLAEDMARYLYLPRLRDDDVLLAAIREGLGLVTWKSDAFAYAERWDEAHSRYQGLRGGSVARVLADSASLLVKSDVAAAQLDAEANAAAAAQAAGAGSGNGGSGAGTTATAGSTGQGTHPPNTAPKPPELRRFHGAVTIDPLRLGRDAGRIAEEVVQLIVRSLFFLLLGTEMPVLYEPSHVPQQVDALPFPEP